MLKPKKKHTSKQPKNISKKYAYYRDALYALLYDKPTGLSEGEIASKLNISESDCHNLLYFGEREELSGRTDERGVTLYTTRHTAAPPHSFEYELKLLKQNKHPILKFLLSVGLVLLLLLGTAFLVSPYLSDSNNSAIAAINDRIEQIKVSATQLKCEWYWRSGDSCYVDGRLLTKAQFQREFMN